MENGPDHAAACIAVLKQNESHGSRAFGGGVVVLSGCEDQSSQVVEHQRKATLAVFFAVSAPSSCSAVGVSVAAAFSLSLCFKSALH